MFVAQHIALAVRKERLLGRIAAQRGELAVYAAPLEKPFALLDTVVHAAHFLKARPWVTGAGVFALVVLRRRHLFRWLGRGWTLWRGWRIASRWLAENGYLKR